jgi:hypothetical protein
MSFKARSVSIIFVIRCPLGNNLATDHVCQRVLTIVHR